MGCHIGKRSDNLRQRSFYIQFDRHFVDFEPKQNIDSVNEIENNCLWNELHILPQMDALAVTPGMVMVAEKSWNFACCSLTSRSSAMCTEYQNQEGIL